VPDGGEGLTNGIDFPLAGARGVAYT